jgi:hypothetical protein
MKNARRGITRLVTAMTSRSLVKTRGIALFPKDRAAMSTKLRPRAICRMRSSTARAVLRFFCAAEVENCDYKACAYPECTLQQYSNHPQPISSGNITSIASKIWGLTLPSCEATRLWAVTSRQEKNWMDKMKTWREISCAASVAVPIVLTILVPYRMTPIVLTLRRDTASPACKYKD